MRTRKQASGPIDLLVNAVERQRLAKAAMQGMLANHMWDRGQINDPKRLAVCAVSYADALLRELNKKKAMP